MKPLNLTIHILDTVMRYYDEKKEELEIFTSATFSHKRHVSHPTSPAYTSLRVSHQTMATRRVHVAAVLGCFCVPLCVRGKTFSNYVILQCGSLPLTMSNYRREKLKLLNNLYNSVVYFENKKVKICNILNHK